MKTMMTQVQYLNLVLMNEIKEECDGKIFFDLHNWNPEDEHCPFQYKRVL